MAHAGIIPCIYIDYFFFAFVAVEKDLLKKCGAILAAVFYVTVTLAFPANDIFRGIFLLQLDQVKFHGKLSENSNIWWKIRGKF